jgi:hypothetical protein
VTEGFVVFSGQGLAWAEMAARATAINEAVFSKRDMGQLRKKKKEELSWRRVALF